MSRFLHWLMGVLILCMLALGWASDFVPLSVKPAVLQLHVLIGLALLGLLALRVAARLLRPAPALDGTPLYRLIVGGAHLFLYAAMLAMPLSGLLYIGARGADMPVFGLFNVPHLVGKDRGLAVFLRDFHGVFAWVFAGAIALHVAAALYHHFFKHDGVLRKMLPERS